MGVLSGLCSNCLRVSPCPELGRADVKELQSILEETGEANADVMRQAAAHGLGLFVRSLVGLDKGTAKAALGDFISGAAWTGNQITFLNLIVDYLAEHGVVEPRVL